MNKEGIDYIGEAVTVDEFSMYIGDFPFVIVNEKQSQVHGELYRISSETNLQPIDELEGHPTEYRRVNVIVRLKDGYNDNPFQAQFYVVELNEAMNLDGESSFEPIRDGNFRSHEKAKNYLV